MTPKEFKTFLGVTESNIPEMRCRVTPSSFDPDDPELRAIPRSLNWRWTSCERFLRNVEARTVLLRLPLFWQIESFLHRACQAVGATILVNEVENMPVGAAAMHSANVNVVMTDTSDAGLFSTYLFEKDVEFPRAWFVVHRGDAENWTLPQFLRETQIRVAQEVHLFPGLPVLDQCVMLADSKETSFHLSDAYIWKIGAEKTTITSVGNDLLPFVKFPLSFVLRTTGMCPCGKIIVERSL
jgi:hypothetical protein